MADHQVPWAKIGLVSTKMKKAGNLLRALRAAAGDGVRFGEESGQATANGDTQRTDTAVSIGATRMRNAWVTVF